MNWFILTLISAITLSIATLLQRVLMKEEKSDPIAYSIVFQLMCATLVVIFAFFNGFILPPIGNLIPNLILEAILYAGSILYLFKALKTIQVAQVTILSSTSAFWSIIASVIFLGESFNLTQVIGSILIFSAVVFVSQNNLNLSFRKGSIYALGSAFCFGVALVNDRFILQSSDAFSYLAIAFLLPGILLAAIKPKALIKAKVFLESKKLKRMSLLAVFYSASSTSTYLAFQAGGKASQIASLSKSSIIITIFLAAMFLGERSDLKRKLISAFIVIVGVLLLK